MGDVAIIDDYASPDEITATIKTAKHYPHKKMWVISATYIFRTKSLLPEFGKH